MSRKVVLTCAVTGGGKPHPKHGAIPITPAQIAASRQEAAICAGVMGMAPCLGCGLPPPVTAHVRTTFRLIMNSWGDNRLRGTGQSRALGTPVSQAFVAL